MNKKTLWIIGGIIAVLIPIITVLCLYNFVWNKEEKVELTSISTANGGTIAPVDKTAASVKIKADGTSESDALYRYESKYGYSLQYNNKYIVDFTGNSADFVISNDSNTVNVMISPFETEGIEELANIQTKEDWDALMGSMLGECLEFKRMPINNMDALVGHYNLTYDNGQVSDVIYAMLIGDEYIYNYMYSATADAPETEQNQIGAILYTIIKQ